MVAGIGVPPHISRIESGDPDEHRAWLVARFHDHQRRVLVRPGGEGFGFWGEVGRLGDSLVVTHSRYAGATVESIWPPLAQIVVLHVRSGRSRLSWDGGETRTTPGGTVLAPPSDHEHVSDSSDSSEYTGVVLGLGVVLRVGQETSGLDESQVRFTGVRPVSAAAERQYLTTADYVRRGIYDRTLDHRLLRAATEQLVAASLLATFPNTTMTTEVRVPRDPATPSVVRRAMAFVDAHAADPITISDIAEAVGVGSRTLQYAFRRHAGLTPTAYLRRTRLVRAHEELLAEPGESTTVAAVAARWGFGSRRFAAAYLEMYGQPPDRTLRR
jgi:AraC-like DNA-binding protein